MGGRIEDKMFDFLDKEKLTVTELQDRLTRTGNPRQRGTVYKHLTKMVQAQQLQREKNESGVYVYWNAKTLNDQR